MAGKNKMLEGELKPFFTIHDIIIPKEILDELWKYQIGWVEQKYSTHQNFLAA